MLSDTARSLGVEMKSKRDRLWRDGRQFRFMLTLGLAVVLPAASLVGVNFDTLKDIKRNKAMEAAFHRDFLQMLAISEKKIYQKAYTMTEEVRDLFPSPETATSLEKEKRLDLILSRSPWLAHVYLFDA